MERGNRRFTGLKSGFTGASIITSKRVTVIISCGFGSYRGQPFRNACLSSRRSGGSNLHFRAGSI